MRTTVDINDELLKEAKRQAADRGVTLRSLFERALRAHLDRPARGGGFRLKWRTEKGRLQPGARLDDRDALFDLMEGRP